MQISSLSGAAPSFDHPLEMLHACHEIILRQCDTLQKLAVHLTENGCDIAAQQAAQGILRYFDTAGKFHHQDEEQDLFPALSRCANKSGKKIDALLQHLLSEHIAMMSAWEELRVVLLKLADGVDTSPPKSLVNRFVEIHTAHIKMEEAELLPLAATLLNANQIHQLGNSMAKRRGVKFASHL